MDVTEFQNKIIEFVAKWDKKRKVTPSEQNTFNHLVEEIGEIARQYVNKESRKDKFDEHEIDDGIGDALIQLVKLAHLRGLTIEELILKIIKKEEKFFKSN